MNTGIIKYGILSLAFTLCTASCSDFLDTEQRGVTTQESFYKTDAEVTEALYAIYNKMQSSDLNTFQFKNLLSDDAMVVAVVEIITKVRNWTSFGSDRVIRYFVRCSRNITRSSILRTY
jgi:hypothetical protein